MRWTRDHQARDNQGMTPRSTIDEITARVAGQTAPKLFLELLAEQPTSKILNSMDGSGGWNTWNVSDVARLTAQSAAGLLANSCAPGERILLMMRNRPDFHWHDLAAQFVRVTPVSIYNSSSPEEIQYLASHAEARLAIVEDEGFLTRLLKVRHELPLLEKIYVIEAPDGDMPEGVAPISELMSHGDADLAALAAATDPNDSATLIYTSGTTGPPKGVMISQFNVVYTADALFESIENPEARGWRIISYLPMAHIAERMTSHYRTIIDGLDVYCCPDPNALMPYIKEVHPQMLFGVPRVFEKIYAGLNAALSADPEKKQQFDDGVAAAIEINRAQFEGTATQEQVETLAFLDAVAFAPVRALVGLGDIELAITGAAPLPAAILEWFNAIGVKLAEVYGLSETSGPMTFSPVRNKAGWVGQQIPGCEVALADDGEVICRGGNVFQGYLNEPQKTADVLVDGWFHSGDIGEIDDEGYVRIVDRKKELIITSGGKNISPANLEAALKMIPIVGQACAIGDQRKFCSALLVLDPEVAPVWAAKNGKAGMSLAELAADPDVRAAIQAGVDEINQQFAQVEQIKRFVVVGEEWLPDTDVLTPTSKLKRRGIHARYADAIESMYV